MPETLSSTQLESTSALPKPSRHTDLADGLTSLSKVRREPAAQKGCHAVQAACYGRAFCPAGSFPRKRLLEVCKLLRLLNALRQPEVGLPMTMAQLEALTPAAVLTRLVTAKRHLLALRIANTLDLAPDQVPRPLFSSLGCGCFAQLQCCWMCCTGWTQAAVSYPAGKE